MKKLSSKAFVGMLVVALFLLVQTVFASGDKEGVYTWKIGTLVPKTVPAGAAMFEFAELVEERTAGRIKINCFPVQQLGFWMDEFDNIMRGIQEMGFLPQSPRYTEFQSLYIDYNVSDWDSFNKAFKKGGFLFEAASEACEDMGIKVLGFVNAGFEGYSGRKGPVVYPEDIKKLGIKTRVGYPASRVLFERLGPVASIDMAEVYTALQLGTIDCQANQSIETVYTQFRDVTDYFTDINSMPAFISILINKDLWDSLSEELQNILQETADEVCEKAIRLSREKEEEYYRLFEEGGGVVTRLSSEQRAKWSELARGPNGSWNSLRNTLGDEVIDFLLDSVE